MSETPVTVLTGFLGAGKTTLLRHLLRTIDAQRVVVVENEFGAANIDSEFLEEIAPGMMRTLNGCICCAVQVDLQHTFRSLLEARAEGAIDFERVILETTGMADAAAVVETFQRGDDLSAGYRVDAVVTVVDARHIAVDMANSPVAQSQIALADVLVISKTDLVDVPAAKLLDEQLAVANPTAARHEARFGVLDPAHVLDVGAFGQMRLARVHTPVDHGDFGSVLLEDPGPHDIRRVRAWLRRFIRERPYDLYRYKGIVNAAGRARRITLQGVHDLFTLEEARPWRVDEPRGTTLVLIGVGLNPRALQKALEATRGKPERR